MNARRNRRWDESVTSVFKARYDDFKVDRKRVKGRVWWPADPVVLTVDAGGALSIHSAVYDCQWWQRASGASRGERGATWSMNVNENENENASSISAQLLGYTETAGEIARDQKNTKSSASLAEAIASIAQFRTTPKLHDLFSRAMEVYAEMMFYGAYLYLVILMIFLWYCCYHSRRKQYRKPKR